MIKTKYKTTFEAVAHCLVDEEKDKFLAVASLENLKPLLPKEVSLDDNPDLVPFVANGTVVNRGNKNFHLIDEPSCLSVAENFKYKFVDIEHRRDIIVGVISNIGYSKFGSNKVLSKEDVAGKVEPFNLVIGGFVWKYVKPSFTEKLAESNNPSSEWYNKISLSWEVGYDDYYLLIGNPNLSEGKIIKDKEEIAKYEKYLSTNGGDHKTENGEDIYVVITGTNIVPLGFGFTMSPAAEVKGVLIDEEVLELTANVEVKISDISIETTTQASNNTSQEKQRRVNQLEMKITSTKDISEKWNEIRASEDAASLVSFVEQVENKLQEASKVWEKEQAAKEQALAQAAAEKEELQKKLEKFQASLDEANKALQKLEDEKVQKEMEAKFQDRMSALDSEYNLDKETREIVANDIRDLNDESFNKWHAKFKVLAKEKAKTTEKPKTEEAGKTIETALNNTVVASAAIPNTVQPSVTLESRFQEAFALKNIQVNQ